MASPALEPLEQKSTPVSAWNAEYLEHWYGVWRSNPAAVPELWRQFFAGFELGAASPGSASPAELRAQLAAMEIVRAYRTFGHEAADLDPLGLAPRDTSRLALEGFGLAAKDLATVVDAGGVAGLGRAPLRDLIAALERTYCGHVTFEFTQVTDGAQRAWLETEAELHWHVAEMPAAQRLAIATALIHADNFETFLHSRFKGEKRFSLEGGESVLAGVRSLLELAPALGVAELAIAMPHRGRLNMLVNVAGLPAEDIMAEFEHQEVHGQQPTGGDVKYHWGSSTDYVTASGQTVHVSLSFNPSHLEAVKPVVLGNVYAKQEMRGGTPEARAQVLPVFLHGDAALAGQGTVMETLQLAKLPGYATGGVIHVAINNQVGFTTAPEDARSTRHCTDIAKMFELPVIHVNGDDPETVARAFDLALRFRQKFATSIFIDVVCYRRWGHNEGDYPGFTQPVMYKKIEARRSPRAVYEERAIAAGVIPAGELKSISDAHIAALQERLDHVRKDKPGRPVRTFSGRWKGLKSPWSFEAAPTAVRHETLLQIGRALNTVPVGFNLDNKIARGLGPRMETLQNRGADIDWGYAELLAYGALLVEGHPVRLSGQDSERGTFSHRHSVWNDTENGRQFVPLNQIQPGQARYGVFNSPLSEFAVMGFDFGYSLADPNSLVIWEAQFGDFANGAQVIIDQFVCASEAKWQLTSGLVLLLPHAFEGQGPEHSNAYLERYLAACAENNIQVCNLTTPANYFHAVRRQLKRPFRRPLVVMSPKSLLRLPSARSCVADLTDGHFQEFIDDAGASEKAKRVILCSGKVYYELADYRAKAGAKDTAIVRVEQFHPFHEAAARHIAEKYAVAKDIVWCQEEPRNRGGWTFIQPRLAEIFGKRKVRYAGRGATASPAAGSKHIHDHEQRALLAAAFEG